MKVVGFAGSPRIGGNSDTLLDQWLAGAKDAGAEVEKVYLDKLQINPCRACDACRRAGASGCIVRDDMQQLYPKLLAADIWVLATPVYFWTPSSQLKLMVDRWYGMLRHHDLCGKQAALLVSMGDDELKTAQPTIDMFTMAFDYMKMRLLTPQVVTASKRGEVRDNLEAMQLAHAAGRSACPTG